MGRRYLYRDMSGPISTPRSAFNVPTYQQGYHYAGPAQNDQAYGYDGASKYEQAYSSGGGMMQTQTQSSFAACQSLPPPHPTVRLALPASFESDCDDAMAEANFAPGASVPKL